MKIFHIFFFDIANYFTKIKKLQDVRKKVTSNMT